MNDQERNLIIGALNEAKDSINSRLDRIDNRIDMLPCTGHLERLVRVEGKIDELNNVRQTIRNSLIRWLIPYIMAGGIVGFITSYFMR